MKPAVCYGCQTQIPQNEASYSCSPCDFHLHGKCAELPRQITHPLHSQDPLTLHNNPPYSSGKCLCDACGQKEWCFFTYHCSSCKFDLDVSCAILGQELKHKSHQHQLTLQQRRSTFYCNACGMVKEDSSYSCSGCSFWIHKRCALLPETVNHRDHRHDHHHPHLLLLSYCISDDKDFRSFTQICLAISTFASDVPMIARPQVYCTMLILPASSLKPRWILIASAATPVAMVSHTMLLLLLVAKIESSTCIMSALFCRSP